MKNINNKKNRFWIIIAFIFGAALVRIFLSEIPNVAPITAMALFAGAYFLNKRLAIVIPIVIMILSDIVLEAAFMLGFREFSGFHMVMPFVYIAFLLIVFIGSKVKIKPLPILGSTFLSAVLFFFITNFGVWITDAGMFYPLNISGLVSCYIAAIPFFHYTLLGDLLFVGIMFGAFEWLQYRYPSLALARR